MELQTISQVSKHFKISTRTLRYYEQIGLIQSTTKEDYSYWTYDEKLNKLTDRDVRIVCLPPSCVAAYQYEGDDPEMHVHKVVDVFVRGSNLTAIKPDLRHYGFNSPNPVDETGHHGYEVGVTIPDSFSVPEPLVKKHFEGGLYAAHMIPFGAYEEWSLLNQWLENNGKYEFRSSDDYRNMFGLLEEHLNYVNRVHLEDPEEEGCQLDLLMPVKEKTVEIYSKTTITLP